MRFNLVQPHTFTMGTPQGEAGREAQEVQHEVTISRPFYLGAYEVTQAQWQVVMGTTIGMLVANVPVVFFGEALARRLPVSAVRKVAAAAFAILGVAALVTA